MRKKSTCLFSRFLVEYGHTEVHKRHREVNALVIIRCSQNTDINTCYTYCVQKETDDGICQKQINQTCSLSYVIVMSATTRSACKENLVFLAPTRALDVVMRCYRPHSSHPLFIFSLSNSTNCTAECKLQYTLHFTSIAQTKKQANATMNVEAHTRPLDLFRCLNISSILSFYLQLYYNYVSSLT